MRRGAGIGELSPQCVQTNAIGLGKAMEGQLRPVPPRQMVAVVDDDPAVRGSLQFSLEIEGYEVRVFGDGSELLIDPKVARFACLIVDQNLPALSGLEVAEQLRARSVLNPVILITSQPSESLRQRARAAGIPIVEKPLLGNALVDAIHAVLGH
jgi:two-component system response regulator FixJ